jgi:hypothetical protein
MTEFFIEIQQFDLTRARDVTYFLESVSFNCQTILSVSGSERYAGKQNGGHTAASGLRGGGEDHQQPWGQKPLNLIEPAS